MDSEGHALGGSIQRKRVDDRSLRSLDGSYSSLVEDSGKVMTDVIYDLSMLVFVCENNH